MEIKIKENSKDLSVSIEFNTVRTSFGNGQLTYFAPKYAMSKEKQKQYILNKLKIHEMEIKRAIKYIKKNI